MDLKWDPYSLWVRCDGSAAELLALHQELESWCNGQHPVWVWEKNSLHVLAGVAAGLAEQAGVMQQIAERYALEPDAVEDAVGKLDAYLRPYQAEVVQASLLAECGRCLLDVVMGGGKTRISAAIAFVAAQLGAADWLYIVQNKELAAQSEEEFAGLIDDWLDAGCGETRPSLVATTYGSINKLVRKGPFDGILIDEVHTIPARSRAKSYTEVAGYRRIGMSGTPLDRQDPKNSLVIGLTGPLVAQISAKQLMDDGFLTPGVVQPVRI